MRNLLLACVLVGGSGGLALASPDTKPTPIALETRADARAEIDHQLSDAALAERKASARVFFYEQSTTIAERDLATARTRVQTADRAWTAAVRRGNADDAGRWATRHARALADEREALGRLTLDRAERDMARVAFQARIDELHQIATRAGRVKRTPVKNGGRG